MYAGKYTKLVGHERMYFVYRGLTFEAGISVPFNSTIVKVSCNSELKFKCHR